MKYEVWDVGVGKCFGRFETEYEAIRFVRSLLSTNGDAYVDDLVVSRTDDEWGDHNLTGGALLAKARHVDERHPGGWIVGQETSPRRNGRTKVAAMAAKSRE
jgi:hypothetical protein